MKSKKNTKKDRIEKIRNLLEMPKEVISNDPKITIIGFDEMLIENYKGILEYEDYAVRIHTHVGTVNINGINLLLNQITEDDVIISGRIDSIELEEED